MILEVDAGMHKTERAMRDMMEIVGAPFSFYHKRILNLTMPTHAHPKPMGMGGIGHGRHWAWAPDVGLSTCV
jgi:hypothetical protein